MFLAMDVSSCSQPTRSVYGANILSLVTPIKTNICSGNNTNITESQQKQTCFLLDLSTGATYNGCAHVRSVTDIQQAEINVDKLNNVFFTKGKGKGQDNCYSAAYMQNSGTAVLYNL